ncbi:MAG: hypothetical protein IPI92_19895 [Gemmatimonadetes bacterium]|nr:hypothetical protein [Gemmatimonadota bacterium]MBK7352122.1 hypothetical protein [Gemmatimonadota bacterium]
MAHAVAALLAFVALTGAPLRLAAQATARLPVAARVLDLSPSRLALAAVRAGLTHNRRPEQTTLASIRVDSIPADASARPRRRVTVGFLHN